MTYNEWDAWLHLDGWAGQTKQAVRVVGETPKRYRITTAYDKGSHWSLSTCLPGNSRKSLLPGETALVPKRAITPREDS